MTTELKALLTAKKAEVRAAGELQAVYELGKQNALKNGSIDDIPRYRKQNKVAAWLNGFNDGKQEQQAKALTRTAKNIEGIEKIKALTKEILTKK